MTNGWWQGKEINRVTYDPDVVSEEELEHWLRQSKTYRQTIRPEEH